jgi:hypothetical protein
VWFYGRSSTTRRLINSPQPADQQCNDERGAVQIRHRPRPEKRRLTLIRSDKNEYHLGLAETTFLPRFPTEAYYKRFSMLFGHDVGK